VFGEQFVSPGAGAGAGADTGFAELIILRVRRNSVKITRTMITKYLISNFITRNQEFFTLRTDPSF
jgi:hypothetical protein